MAPLAQSLYVLIGGTLAPLLIGVLFGRDRALGGLANPLGAFVVVTGVVLLWPILLALLPEQGQ